LLQFLVDQIFKNLARSRTAVELKSAAVVAFAVRNERVRLPYEVEVTRVVLMLSNKVGPTSLPGYFASLNELPQKLSECISSLSFNSLALGLLLDEVIFVEFANDLFECLETLKLTYLIPNWVIFE
jgi:hypothetical protein